MGKDLLVFNPSVSWIDLQRDDPEYRKKVIAYSVNLISLDLASSIITS